MFAMDDAIPDAGGAAIMGWRQQKDGKNRDQMTTSTKMRTSGKIIFRCCHLIPVFSILIAITN